MSIALGELDLDEVLRYMGTPPSQAGPELRALAEECGRAVCAAARPRWAWRAFDIAEEADGVRLSCGLLLPGQDLKYGDLPLELQNPLLDLLDAPRRVGLCASASHILTPRKSVTAILGAADGPIQPTVRSCLGCPARESCQYRKSGGHCGIS